MNAHDGLAGRRTSLASGIAVTALVVVMGVAVAIAEMQPEASAVAVEGPVTQAAAVATTDGFRVPDELRINAAEVPPHVEAF